MRKILPADVADPGLVRLGAGMRAGARRPAPHAAQGRPADAPARGFHRPVPARGFGFEPSAVADAGRVRLGAGMRRG